MKKISLTGDRPTGNLHLGHYIGSLKSRIEFQEIYNQYIMIADVQALTDNFDNPKKIFINIIEVVKDYISIGIDPNKSTIFVQSQIAELFELTVYFMNLVTIGRLERNPTVKTEIKQKNFGESIPVGFFCYPISQAADILGFMADVVPVGEDQLPMIEQTNEIVRKFNRIYNTEVLKEVRPHLSQTSKLIGIDGIAKAGKTLNNAIYLSDNFDILKQKVFSMFTDPNHIKVTDPGKVEGNVVFAYLDAFYKDKEELSVLKEHYKRGGLGDVTIKNILLKELNCLLEPIREIRIKVKNDFIMDLLATGSKKAKEKAKDTLKIVKNAISLI